MIAPIEVLFLLGGGDYVMPRLSEQKKEQIKALLAQGMSQRRIAKEVGVAVSTVNKVSKESKDEVEHLRTHKKEQWIEEAWKTINLYMQHVQDPKVIQRTSARDSAILIGTLHDKMLKAKELELKREELELKKKELEKHNQDDDKLDQLLEAMMESARNVQSKASRRDAEC